MSKKSRFQTVTATAPSYWASYLINGDASGIDASERIAADAWLIREDLGLPVSCADYGFTQWHDASFEAPFAADCDTYTFLVAR